MYVTLSGQGYPEEVHEDPFRGHKLHIARGKSCEVLLINENIGLGRNNSYDVFIAH